jgi:transcriptional regulator with XRE-family HTH domain
MLNISSSLVAELREKEYRDAYVESQIRMTLPLQIRELRKRREWTQPELAQRAGMGQPRISELEKPGERRLTIETLLRLASDFDVGLQVKFVPFEELIDCGEKLDIDQFNVLPFEKELKEAETQTILGVPRKPAVGVSGGANAAAKAAGATNQSQGKEKAMAAAMAGGQSGDSGNINGTNPSVPRNGGLSTPQRYFHAGIREGLGATLQFPEVSCNVR